jgi:prepilin-type processing-associated H-X9-DG protein
MDAAYPYTRSEQIFVCPDDATNNVKYRYYLKTSGDEYYFGSYVYNNTYNDTCSSQWGQTGPAAAKIMTVVASPSTTAWILENVPTPSSGGVHLWWGSFVATYSDSPPAGTIVTAADGHRYMDGGTTLVNIDERHLDTTNVLYCDGHVKAVRLEALTVKKPVYIPIVAGGCGGLNANRDVMTAFTVQDD